MRFVLRRNKKTERKLEIENKKGNIKNRVHERGKHLLLIVLEG